jgi:hypothetical protein
MRWRMVAAIAASIAVGGCRRGPDPALEARIAELTAASAEKDSLLQQVAENARLMSEISAELVTVADPAKLARVAQEAESPVSAKRDSLRTMVNDVTTRLSSLEERLAVVQRRVRSLTRTSDSVRAALDQAIADLRATIENQKATIAVLASRTDVLETENVRLASEKAALADTVDQLITTQRQVYYIIGTKEELKEKGIVTEVGGSRVLFIFGKRGTTLVPARELDPNDFTAIDMMTTTEIPLPDSGAAFRVASRQNLAFLADPPDRDGKVRGTLRITSPEEFWLPSKFLVLVRS